MKLLAARMHRAGMTTCDPDKKGEVAIFTVVKKVTGFEGGSWEILEQRVVFDTRRKKPG